MSEVASTAGSAPSAGATQSSASANSQASTQSQGVGSKPMTHAQSAQPQGQQAAQATARELGDADMDALVRVKVNGEEKRIPLKEAIKISQLEQASHEKMRQAAEERKRVQGEWQQRQRQFDDLKKNPEKLAEFLGIDLDAFSEERLARKYERMQMDPHQRQALEYKEQLDAINARENATKQELINQIKEVTGELPQGIEGATKEQLNAFLSHQKELYNRETQKYEQEVAQAWLETGLPKYSSVGKDIAFQMLKAQKQGRSLQPKEAAAIVKNERLTSAREILSQMDANAIHEFLGPELIKKLKDHDIERVNQTKGPQFGNQNGPGYEPASPQPKKQLNQQEWRKAMGIA